MNEQNAVNGSFIDPEKYYTFEEAVKLSGYSKSFFKHYISPKITGSKEGRNRTYLGSSILEHRKKEPKPKKEKPMVSTVSNTSSGESMNCRPYKIW